MKRREPPVIPVDPTKWYAVSFGAKPFREECCDCGLVHRVDFKLENGRFWVQYQRDEPATKQARTRMEKQGMKMPKLPSDPP